MGILDLLSERLFQRQREGGREGERERECVRVCVFSSLNHENRELCSRCVSREVIIDVT